MKIINNTDSVDIDESCLGLNVSYEKVSPLNKNRGLHIQIRHNSDERTFEEANRISNLLSAAPDMLKQLIVARELISRNMVGNAYLERGEIDRVICGALGLNYKCVKTAVFEKAISIYLGGAA